MVDAGDLKSLARKSVRVRVPPRAPHIPQINKLMQILVTGATGYVGGRLVPQLISLGHQVTVLVRDTRRIQQRPWFPQVTVIEGDILERNPLWRASLKHIDAAYYLIHSMKSGKSFDELDAQAAHNFGKAARNIQKIIYLGGLLPQSESISTHLSSRARTGEILAQYSPVTEFRAGPIIGAGSTSFEMVRYLTERLPIMVAPKWILHTVQPIAIRDVLTYLIEALEKPALGAIDIGGERLTFKDMMLRYAKIQNLKRHIFRVPVLTPRLASLWVGLVTPIPNRLATPLIQGIVHPVLAHTKKAELHFPHIQTSSYEIAVKRALEKIDAHTVETRWCSALGTGSTYELTDWKGMIVEEQTRHIKAPPDAVFAIFSELGGERGWLTWNWAWRLRGFFDRLLGGPGLRRGRRGANTLITGEAIDFWRIEAVEPPYKLLLRAEMKVPGKAWLYWKTFPENDGCRLVQSALFAPKGIGGPLYWYLLYPIHKKIFSDLINAIAREAQKSHRINLEPHNHPDQ